MPDWNRGHGRTESVATVILMGFQLHRAGSAARVLWSACQRRFLGVHVAAEDSEQPRKAASVNDQLDVTVHDTEVLDEIEMMTNLIIATSESAGPLAQVQIDSILGVEGDVPSH